MCARAATLCCELRHSHTPALPGPAESPPSLNETGTKSFACPSHRSCAPCASAFSWPPAHPPLSEPRPSPAPLPFPWRCRSFGRRFYLAAIPKFIQDLLGFVGPFASSYIIEWLDDPNAAYYVGFMWALALFFGPFLQTVFVNQYFALTFNTGMHVWIAGARGVVPVPLRADSARD